MSVSSVASSNRSDSFDENDFGDSDDELSDSGRFNRSDSKFDATNTGWLPGKEKTIINPSYVARSSGNLDKVEFVTKPTSVIVKEGLGGSKKRRTLKIKRRGTKVKRKLLKRSRKSVRRLKKRRD
jgi:hypothetical protein